MSVEVTPYIFFKGNCREAMEFYKNVLGGELTIQTYSDVNVSVDGNKPDDIMHAMLEGGVAKLMASDTALASPEAKKISISLSGDEEALLTKVFEGLSQDVEVRSPLKKEFWGDTFGSVTDKFGIEWMVNITAPKTA